MKVCKICGIEKNDSEFRTRIDRGKASKRNECKVCENRYFEKWNHEHPLYYSEYRRKSSKSSKEQSKKWRMENPEKWHQSQKKYKDKEREHIRAYSVEYNKKRRQQDIAFRIKHNLSSRIRRILKCKGGSKSIKTIELLGCSIDFFKEYVESKFLPRMTWDNYGFGPNKWNLDHIKPCASFNLLLEEEQKRCFHYTNYQPLWMPDNLRKWAIDSFSNTV